MDPITGAAVIGAGSSLLGGLLQGSSNESRESLAERKRQFDLLFPFQKQQGNRASRLAEGQSAAGLQNQIAMAPLRDKAAATLMGGMGRPTQGFQAGNVLTGAQAQGIAPAQQFNTPANYKMGDGGFDPAVLQRILSVLGYGAGGTYKEPGELASDAQFLPSEGVFGGKPKMTRPSDIPPGSSQDAIRRAGGLTTQFGGR